TFEKGLAAERQASYSEALAYFLKVRKETETLLLSPDQHAKLLHALAAAYQNTGQISAAEACLTQAMEAWAKSTGPEGIGWAPALSNLGGVRTDRGRFSGAGQLYHRALPLYGRVLGGDPARTATISSHLAEVYMMEGKLAAAGALLPHAVAIHEAS